MIILSLRGVLNFAKVLFILWGISAFHMCTLLRFCSFEAAMGKWRILGALVYFFLPLFALACFPSALKKRPTAPTVLRMYTIIKPNSEPTTSYQPTLVLHSIHNVCHLDFSINLFSISETKNCTKF